ncbi:MAG: hypothetical protein H6741_26740 [Alphaproteobacteria bacterium]|nr:hypothetical protein [Alphaproteobacteria bacterium]
MLSSDPRYQTRVLFVGWAGGGMVPLHVATEADGLHAALKASLHHERFELHVLLEPGVPELEAALRRLRPHVLHLSAHGNELGRLYVREGEDYVTVEYEALAGTIAVYGEQLRLVVLNACYSSALADLLSQTARAVVGIDSMVDDRAALGFASSLYGALGDGDDLADAVAVAMQRARQASPRLPGRYRMRASPSALLDRVRVHELERPAPSRRSASEDAPSPPLAMRAAQILVVLDVYSTPFPLDEVIAQVDKLGRPHERRQIVRISEFNAPRVQHGQAKDSFDWPGLRRAAHRMMSELTEGLPADGRPVDYVLCGFAPLPVFAQVGFELSRWRSELILVNRRPDRTWDVLELDAAPTEPGPVYFDLQRGLDVQRGYVPDGRVAVFVCNVHNKGGGEIVPIGMMEAFARSSGSAYKAIVSLVNTRAEALSAGNAVQALNELSCAMSEVSLLYRGSQGVDLFVGGAAPLGFLAGQAINPNQFRDVRVPEFEYGVAYLPAVELPHRLQGVAPLPTDEGARRRRADAWGRMLRAVKRFREAVTPEDLLPPATFPMGDGARRALAEALYADLMELDLSAASVGEDGAAGAHAGGLSMDLPLLHALSGLPEAQLDILGPLFVLHELLPFDRQLRSAGCWGAEPSERSYVELDDQADSFALAAWAAVGLRTREADARVNAVLTQGIHAHLCALVALDRLAQGDAIVELSERRMGRYLGWALQLARATKLRRAEELEALFGERLAARLAPFGARLDTRGERILTRLTPDSELRIALGGRLARSRLLAGGAGPGALLEAVRGLRVEEMEQLMQAVVDEHAGLLVPWRRSRW